MYWRLMNAMRRDPCFPRFSVTYSLKAEFWITLSARRDLVRP